MKNEVSKAIIRLIVMAILAVNAILTANGHNPIPFNESAFTEVATYILAGAAAVWSWWKNNNITKKAQEAQNTLRGLKEDGDGSDWAVEGEIVGIEESEVE